MDHLTGQIQFAKTTLLHIFNGEANNSPYSNTTTFNEWLTKPNHYFRLCHGSLVKLPVHITVISGMYGIVLNLRTCMCKCINILRVYVHACTHRGLVATSVSYVPWSNAGHVMYSA